MPKIIENLGQRAAVHGSIEACAGRVDLGALDGWHEGGNDRRLHVGDRGACVARARGRGHREVGRGGSRNAARRQERRGQGALRATSSGRSGACHLPAARRQRESGKSSFARTAPHPFSAPGVPALRAGPVTVTHSPVGRGELDDRGRGWRTVRGKSGLHWARCQITPGRPGHTGRRTGQQRTDRPPDHRWVRVKRWGKSPPRGRQRSVARQPPAGARPSKRREVPTSTKTPRVGCYRSRVTGSAEE